MIDYGNRSSQKVCPVCYYIGCVSHSFWYILR